MPQSPLLPEHDPQTLDRCAVTDPGAIAQVLDDLVQARAVVALHSRDGGADLSRLTGWDARGLRLDPPADDRRLAALTRTAGLTAVASLDGVRYQFDLQTPVPANDAAYPALVCTLPQRAYRLQRRDAFRVNPPETYPVECVIRSMGDEQNVYRVLDLSPEGLALILGPGHPTPESGESWSHCRVEIPGYPPIPCDLVVRFVSDTLMGDGQSRRIGCEFDRPSPQAQRALQVYVTDLQSGRYQRLAN